MKFYTLWLSLICIILFILQLVIPGLTDSLVLNQNSFQQVWRFITSIFLHGSLTHLVFNLFALILFGLITEKIICSNKFLLVFLSTGIFANLIAVNFYDSSLGASGAIYGILGVLTIIRPRMTVWVFNMPMPMFVAAIVWIAIGIFGIFNPSNVGDIAHISGIFLGLILGFYFRLKHKDKQDKKLRADYSRVNLNENEMRNWEDKYLER